jgi:hypothetical protein
MLITLQQVSRKDVEKEIKGVEAWFVSNPKRKVCRTPQGNVRRGHVREDVDRLLRFRVS